MNHSKMKRFFALALCVAQLFACVPSTYAEEPATDGEAAHEQEIVTQELESAPVLLGAAPAAEGGDKPCETHTWSDGTCSVCGKVCDHADDSSEGKGVWENAVYKKVNGEVHHAVYDFAKRYTCTTCGKQYTVIVEKGREDDEEHVYSDGTECVFCGAVKPCETHTWSDGTCSVCGKVCDHADDSSEGKGVWENAVYKKVNGEVHHAVYDYAERYTCTTCGKQYTVIVEKGREDDEEHVYSDGTECVFCGAVKPCETHTEPETLTVVNGEKAYTSTAEGHVASFTRTASYVCTVCSVNVTKSPETITEEQAAHAFTNSVCAVCGYTCTAHSFTDGVCSVCGAVNTCTHPAQSVETWKSDEYVEGSAWTDNGDGTHSRMAYVTDGWMCYECGESKETESDEAEVVTYRHDFEDDACWDCGAVNTCTHPAESVRTGTRIAFAEGGSWADNGDGTHTATVFVLNFWECMLCGKYESTQQGEAEVRTEVHDFYDGICWDCGATNTCEHPAVSVDTWTYYWLVDGSSWVDNGDGTHIGTAYVVDCWECEACGDYKETESDEAEVVTQAHDFSDGACWGCGATNTCEHPAVSVDTWTGFWLVDGSSWVDNGDGTHTGTVQFMDCWECQLCGEYGETYYDGTEVLTEKHWYEDGVCEDCGATNTCAHENLETYVEIDFDSKPKADNGLTHSGVGNRIQVVSCEYCNEVQSETVLSGTVLTEAHFYDGNTCFECGYETKCDHKETSEIIYSELIGAATVVDENTHKGLYNVNTDVWCELCRETISSKLTESKVERTEVHNYISGKCYDCGYVNPCKHTGETYSYSWYDEQKNLKADDASTHSFTGTEHKTVFCSLCDDVLERKVTENVAVTETHTYNSNLVCIYCLNQKDALPTATPTPAPTPAPTKKPSSSSSSTNKSESDDYIFVPTPAPTATPAPAEPEEMIATLVSTVELVKQEGENVTVEIVGAQEVFTEENYKTLQTLPVSEQILVTLSSIGFEEVVSAAMTAMNTELSEDAAVLIESANAALEAISEEERTAMQQKIEENFPKTEILVDGVVYEYFVLDLEINVDGKVRVERYGFRYDEELSQWIFVKLDLVNAYVVTATDGEA